MSDKSIDESMVTGLGDDWERFDQSDFLPRDIFRIKYLCTVGIRKAIASVDNKCVE
jgi:hypothetical protein